MWERIFDREFRVNPLDGQGTGLGLYAARKDMERLGGEIFVSSSIPGEGTTFTILLPAQVNGGELNDSAGIASAETPEVVLAPALPAVNLLVEQSI